ncbi:MAG: DEAD/DEAH box helicase [Ignavibacteriales bacterium]|nr:DEAD/DEAH box helicase [Ignavibacteriales bacterium]
MERADQPDGFITAIRRVPAAATPATRTSRRASTPGCARPSSRRGIDRLYTHQARAIAHALAGRHVVVDHADGVREDALLQRPGAERDPRGPATRALYLFPTKALAQDQLAELRPAVAGDQPRRPTSRSACSPTTATRRRTRARAIRGRAHVVLTNPDMLHAGILPHHPKWAKLFENLRYIVIDELHAYRGVFGSHLANVLRRLRRVCRALRLVADVHLLVGDDRQPDGAGREPDRAAVRAGRRERRAARREVASSFVQPADREPRSSASAGRTSRRRARVALEFLHKGLQVIVFAQSRLVDRDPDDAT